MGSCKGWLLQIRRAEIDDRDVVLSWMNNEELWAVDNPEPFSNKSAEEFDPSWNGLVSLSSTWIIDVADVSIGHLGWVPLTEEIGEFYIVIGDKTYWRKGIGRRAMAWMLATAKHRQLTALYGRVLGHNATALNFFRLCGFKPIARTENFFERDGLSHDLHWIAHSLS